MTIATDFPEPEYRQKIQQTYDALERALSQVDPDVAECEQASGVLTITLADRSRCILSGQPAVRQLWVAIAALGTAYHFNFDRSTGRWMDDKGKGIELMSYLKRYLKDKTGQELSI